METKNLKLVPHAPEHLRALIQGPDFYAQSFGSPPAKGLRDFFASDDVSPDWLAQLEEMLASARAEFQGARLADEGSVNNALTPPRVSPLTGGGEYRENVLGGGLCCSAYGSRRERSVELYLQAWLHLPSSLHPGVPLPWLKALSS